MSDVVLVMPTEGFWNKLSNGHTLPAAVLAASSLLDKEGYSVKIIDQRVNPMWKHDLKKELDKQPLFAGTTAMTGPQISSALTISRIIKESETPVVWGGVHPSLLPQQTLVHPHIDMVVQGEGEATLLELAVALEKQKSLSGIKGLWYKKGEKIVSNPTRPFSDMNDLPDLPYHLVDVTKYSFTLYGTRMLAFFSSRGCPFACGFCYNSAYNQRKWRALTAKNTLERVDYLLNTFKVDGVWFRDDNFFVDKKRADDILRGIKKMDADWGASGARVDFMNVLSNHFIDLMNKSGCKFLVMGAESGSNRILKLVKKGITQEKIIGLNIKLRKLNAVQRYNLMVGFPSETRKDIRDTVNLALRLLKDNKNAIVSQFLIFTPYPGTALFDMAVERGFKPPDKLEGWSALRFEKTSLPWQEDGTTEILRMLAFTSWFLDKKMEGLAKSKWLRLLTKIYRPLANYRFKNLDNRLPLEIKLAERIGF